MPGSPTVLERGGSNILARIERTASDGPDPRGRVRAVPGIRGESPWGAEPGVHHTSEAMNRCSSRRTRVLLKRGERPAQQSQDRSAAGHREQRQESRPREARRIRRQNSRYGSRATDRLRAKVANNAVSGPTHNSALHRTLNRAA